MFNEQKKYTVFLNKDIATKLDEIAKDSFISVSDILVSEFYKTKLYKDIQNNIKKDDKWI